MAKQLCLKRYFGNVGSLEVFLACTLISLDKNPGERPIWMGEVTKTTLGSIVMTTTRTNILEYAIHLQVCVGQQVGQEVAVGTLSSIYSKDESNVTLLLDVDNAFIRISRNVMLNNIQMIFPIIATYAVNPYSQEARLTISGGEEIKSVEGVTQHKLIQILCLFLH